MTDFNNEQNDEMTLDQRVEWLRDRGVLIETPEERKRVQVASTIRHAEGLEEDEVSYVLVPADTSRPLQELTFRPSDYIKTNDEVLNQTLSNIEVGGRDLLLQHLKPAFSSTTDSAVDIELLKKHSTTTLASSANISSDLKVSDQTLKQVAADANIEVFSLVKPLPSNNFTGINIYLDEVGMLKRLPLNKRASDYALSCGFNPPPQFYGDIFLGRVNAKGKVRNTSFVLGPDTAMDAPWLKNAINDNLTYQMEINQITGRKDVRQPDIAGQDGKEKREDGYSWTQTEAELEVIVHLPTSATTKDVQIKFLPKSLQISYFKEPIVAIQLFERIDVDSCTWTLENTSKQEKKSTRLIISMEKLEAAFWPRIED